MKKYIWKVTEEFSLSIFETLKPLRIEWNYFKLELDSQVQNIAPNKVSNFKCA